jgi:hypothetical protein
MCASDRDVTMRASINAMATSSPDSVGPRPAPTTKAADYNALDMRRQCRLQAHLGRNLQVVYQELVEEPLPHSFLNLLDGLKRKEKET